MRTLHGNPWRSTDFAVAALFNATALLHWYGVFFKNRTGVLARPGLDIAAGFVLLILLVSGVFAKQAFDLSRQELGSFLEPDQDERFVAVSYLAFRLYIMVLGTAVILLSLADMHFQVG